MRASNSSIQCFKSCRRMYELKYIYGLEPVKHSEAIDRGLSYHEGVEQLLKDWIDYHNGTPLIQDPKISAMVQAFNVYVIPALAAAKVKPVEAEPWFSFKTKSGHTVVGRADGRMSGNSLIEHKTTRGLIDGDYYQRLDEENTEQKINVIELRKTEEELKAFEGELDEMLNLIEGCKNFYRNPSHCMKWGRLCEYAPVCMKYDPNQEYIGFTKGR